MIKLFTVLVAIAVFTIIIKKKLDPRIAFLLGGAIILAISCRLNIIYLTLLKAKHLFFPAIIIMLSFGFAGLLKKEKYIDSTIALFSNSLNEKRSKFFILFIAVLSTWLGSLAFLSANASCGMIAPILFPIFSYLGVNSELAAASLIAGAWGSIIHPGDINSNIIQQTLTHECQLKNSEIGNTTSNHILPALVSIIVIVVAFYLLNRKKMLLNLNKHKLTEHASEKMRFRQIIPFAPFILLAAYAILPYSWKIFSSKYIIISSLIVGCGFSILFANNSTKESMGKAFYTGVIKGLKDVILLIIASKIFIAGFIVGIGEDTIANWLQKLGDIRILMAVIITYLFAIFTGSGDAIVTSIVQVFVPTMSKSDAILASSYIWFSGEMGRCVSPVSAATLTVTQIASTTPGRVIKKSIIPVSIGLFSALLVLYLSR